MGEGEEGRHSGWGCPWGVLADLGPGLLAASLASSTHPAPRLLCLHPLCSPSIPPPHPSPAPPSCFSASFPSPCVSVFSLSLWMGLFLHVSLRLSLCVSVCLSVSSSFCLKLWRLWSPHLPRVFVSLCRVFLLVSLSLSVHLHLPVCVFPGGLSVHPSMGLRQLTTPPASHLMCGCEIPFEYCRSELTVAKGTGQEKWGDGDQELGGGCGYAFLFSSSLVLSFSEA